mmetsp:Transcript_10483/g.10052  ORF Transcript_10483/g.10052 Transcript_10483/m.10052 type:complete len:83 (+) Transcript_10483:562-810(+)|eukprot:CAMPEP_0197829048 /NCGR_PEP_ID=MMETSP1437-20131217/5526_1 /TAXON_ID=49252 ORGANISM="Eucampia antarctica, Strain CCMP1452" /NCGR_SAMPLE_ID=MMETSP1437 /ASSEMBLY_ACC=CAM_ASM_001096 /LENGTH=82 /DNA_ID=CAMNT_0043430525 /DNA_START=562 /DNA_END=810 /DNA_ORIENTATION=+
MIFIVKEDERRRARPVAGGNLLKLRYLSSRFTVIKGSSVILLDVISHRSKPMTICGDICNAFVTLQYIAAVYPRAGREFRDK